MQDIGIRNLRGCLSRRATRVSGTYRLDGAPKPCAVINRQARREDASLHTAGWTQAHAFKALQVSLNCSINNDFARLNIRLHAACRTDGNAGFRQADFSLRLTINV
ncbi:MAG: hypothetical protein WA405_01490 [Candidatus Acidiferrales bacterium]